ncbi:hypothetical protein GCM10023220_35080 [Streptomyces ziwulingensis]|uniref:Uncharacterized protein n=1 Tax=Streptomyces ziwulingensis TaxID=1045501 RepID=A0ABP9C372_9ACTN
MCAFHRVLPPRHPGRSAKVGAKLGNPYRRTRNRSRKRRTAAVRLGRYLDVEITLVHEGGPVMPGPRVACAPQPRRGPPHPFGDPVRETSGPSDPECHLSADSG